MPPTLDPKQNATLPKRRSIPALLLIVAMRSLLALVVIFLSAIIGVYVYGVALSGSPSPSRELLDLTSILGPLLAGAASPGGVVGVLIALLSGGSFAFLHKRPILLLPLAASAAYVAFHGMTFWHI